MKIFIIPLLMPILLIFPTVSVYSQGTRIDDSFFSAALDTTRMVDVHLPEGYNQDDTGIRYPVVYFLHGWGTNHNDYPQMISAWASLISDSIIHPVILVKPDSYAGPWQGCWYINSEFYGAYEDYIVNDLVTYIDSAYNTIANVDKRILIGHSMGGFGAVTLGFKHPDIFRFIISLSAPLEFNQPLELMFDQILIENGGSWPFNPHAGVTTEVTFSLAGAFSPNFNNPPYYVDFPIDSEGTIIDSVYSKWLPHSPTNLVKQNNPDTNLTVYFDCGTEEDGSPEFALYPANVTFSETLDSLQFPHTFYSFNGGHWENLQTRIYIGLTFIDSVMWEGVSSLETYENKQKVFRLSQNYPNPFNPSTNIEFSISRSEFVTLKIYNLLGQEISSLVSEKLNAGSYTFSWDAGKLSSGVYLYQLEAGDYAQTRKMVLLQ